MSDESGTTSFEKLTEFEAERPTLIEGLPGHGLVASIAADQITEQLGLEHHGNIHCDEFPPVVSFNDGRVRELVRVYSGADPPVMTLQSDITVPSDSYRSLSRAVLEDLADEFERAIFVAGAPAESRDDLGNVLGVATTDDMERALTDVGVTLADGSGLVGGVTGALVNECYRRDVPAALLIVRADPYVPDPAAARAVIENALEPLVRFDIDTQALLEQAEKIQQQKKQVAQQLRQAHEREKESQRATRGPSMYQ